MLMGVSTTWIPVPAICLHTCCVTLGKWPAPSESLSSCGDSGDSPGSGGHERRARDMGLLALQ